MDVHAGNIVHTEAGLRLIDWEYAGDGDIALELAAVWMMPSSAASWSPHMPGGRASTRSSCGGRFNAGVRGSCC
jgi:thiamine kinase-like enzyme